MAIPARPGHVPTDAGGVNFLPDLARYFVPEAARPTTTNSRFQSRAAVGPRVACKNSVAGREVCAAAVLRDRTEHKLACPTEPAAG